VGTWDPRPRRPLGPGKGERDGRHARVLVPDGARFFAMLRLGQGCWRLVHGHGVVRRRAPPGPQLSGQAQGTRPAVPCRQESCTTMQPDWALAWCVRSACVFSCARTKRLSHQRRFLALFTVCLQPPAHSSSYLQRGQDRPPDSARKKALRQGKRGWVSRTGIQRPLQTGLSPA